MATYGQPMKAGKSRRDTPSAPARGRTIAQRLGLVSVVVRDAEPIGTAMMASLHLTSLTQSPASNGGGGGVTMSTGAGIVGRDARRTGALQNWHGAARPVANPRGRKTGIQAGPSSQAAFPSTGSTATPGIMSSLAGMGLPQVLPTPGVRR